MNKNIMYRIIKFAHAMENSSFKVTEAHISSPFKISGIKKMTMNANSTFPLITNKIRPYYETKKNIGIFVSEGLQKIELYCPDEKKYESFILSPDNIYKNNTLVADTPSLLVWNSGLFYRFTTGVETTNSLQFISCVNKYDDYQNAYEIDIQKHYYRKIPDVKTHDKDVYDCYEKKVMLQGGL